MVLNRAGFMAELAHHQTARHKDLLWLLGGHHSFNHRFGLIKHGYLSQAFNTAAVQEVILGEVAVK